jgi:hypothetical protein
MPRRSGSAFRCLRFQSLFLLVFCLASTGVLASGPSSGHPKNQLYALIFGTVWGPDDRPLYGVKVRIRRQDEKKSRWELYSDHNGEFAQRVPAVKADYVIWADLKGYKSPTGAQLRGEEVQVHVEYDEKIDTGLHLK